MDEHFDEGALFRSLITVENPFNSIDEIVRWIERRNQEVKVDVRQVEFGHLPGWHFNENTGDLCHESGKFFSIVGIDVFSNTGTLNRWQQPIINQPEVGYLGILCKEFDGVLYFLLQAKIEPGNVNCVQLSPTLQATRSNYTQVHGGRKPAFLNYFRDASLKNVILDQLQSEQGARFLRKRNRNMIVLVNDDLDLDENFRWLTLGQIKELMSYDNMINMDTRTVLSALRFPMMPTDKKCSRLGELLFESENSMCGLYSMDEVLHQVSALKSVYELFVDKIPLKQVSDWIVTDSEIYRPDRRYFRVIGVDVTIDNREVSRWGQPLVQPMQQGLCVLFMKRIHGILHFLLQAKVECGNFDVVEFAPTIQCLTGDWRTEPPERIPPFVIEFTGGSIPGRKLFDTLQSEEGGRFYREQNRNVLYLLDETVRLEIPKRFVWLTLGQIKEFLRFNNFLNIQVRSLISALMYL